MTLHHLLTLLAGGLAGAGALSLIAVLLGQGARWQQGSVRVAMSGLGAAGLVLLLGSVAQVLDANALYHGLLLVVFASGTRLARRPAST